MRLINKSPTDTYIHKHIEFKEGAGLIQEAPGLNRTL